MQHDLPRLLNVVPFLNSKFLCRLYLLSRGIFLFRVSAFNEVDDAITDKSASVSCVVEYGVTKILEMHSDLVGATSYWVALKERSVCGFIIPYFLEDSLTILDVAICLLLLVLFGFTLYRFVLFFDFLDLLFLLLIMSY